ncbi:MAG TPA: glycosyltransferase family 4 protein [Pyrinomonadaceae bacterium]|nr:glycosyltransferase family 4 protein [Pyrinomonadaceae bacterium]
MRKLRVTALTAGRHDPSRRFRVCQFAGALARRGIEVAEHHPFFSKYTPAPAPALGFVWTAGKILARVPGVAAARLGDLTWLQRELVPGRLTLENFAGRKLLFDVDDAVWTTQRGDSIDRIAALARGVIAGNEFLADYFRRRGARVWVVPTCVDTDRWKPGAANDAAERAEWVVGWSGTSSNLKYLYAIEEPLAEFLGSREEARLLVVSDAEPRFKRIPRGRWRFERWSPAAEVRQARRMDVGLMPLAATDWERGKCGCKLLTYMAVSVPSVASPVGVAAEIMRQAEVGLAATTPDDWYGALVRLRSDRALASRLGAAGRRLVEERYSVARHAETLAGIFRQVAEED